MAGCYLDTGERASCTGCEACVQSCRFGAIAMLEDEEGFRYPSIDSEKCTDCGACRRTCPHGSPPTRNGYPVVVFGGHHRDPSVLEESTSGGAFSAILAGWFGQPGNRVSFGAVAHGLDVRHEVATSVAEAVKFRKSKYAQSAIGDSYAEARRLLKGGWHVLFSGTPCQVAGLKAYLGGLAESPGLLTVEVICEGVPSPLYVRAYDEKMLAERGSRIAELDYRCKDGRKWDFEVMSTSLESGHHFKVDRWFNAFWYVWLDHLMSRPSCYECPYACRERVADVSLGDLWGVHLYCPDLYARNAGASLVVCNSDKGAVALGDALPYLEGRELDFEDAVRYQSPMRKSIDPNPQRGAFMADLREMGFDDLNEKWACKPTAKLLWQKYVWGNRQKVALWNARRAISSLIRGRKAGR